MIGKHKQGLWLAVCILLFFIVMLLLFQRPEPPKPAYVSTSAQPDGTKGLSLLLKEKGHRVSLWQQTWRRLPIPAPEQRLLVVEPGESEPAEQEALMHWIESGGSLVLFDSDPSEFSDMLALDRKRSQGTQAEGVASVQADKAAEAYGFHAGETYRASVSSQVRLRTGDAVTALLSDRDGVLAAEISLGSGKITVFLTPEWLTNGTVLQHDHFNLIWPLLRDAGTAPGTLLVDEYHHGYRKQPGMFAVYPAWLLLCFIQLGAAVLLWLWLRGKRFGPVYLPREWVVRRGDETLLAVAGWYERRGCRMEALRIQERYFRRLLQDRWGLHATASEEVVAQAAGVRWNEADVEQLRMLLRRFEWIHSVEASGRQGLYTAKAFVQDTDLAQHIVSRLEKE